MTNKLFSLLFLSVGVISPTFATTCTDVVKDANGNITQPSTCVIFVSTNTYNGDLGGYSGADNKCQAEAKLKYPDLTNKGITFKALLAFNHATQMDVNYYRTNGITIIAKAAGPNLARTLNNSILNSATPGTFPVWTGLINAMSRPDLQYTCDHWKNYKYKSNNITHDYYGYYGYADISGRGWDNGNKSACRDKKYLICVAQ